jgi:hypothetical protein
MEGGGRRVQRELMPKVLLAGHSTPLSLCVHTPWPGSASELYRPSDRRLSAKLAPTFADRGCRVVSAADPHVRVLGFLDRLPWTYSRSFKISIFITQRRRFNSSKAQFVLHREHTEPP